MVAIQPENARTAAAHLRDRASAAAELNIDLRQAALLSELDTSGSLAACAEIDEELVLLARILTARADEAEGFFLPGNNWRLTSTLLGSLVDGIGGVAEMTTPLALHILSTQGTHAAVDGSNPTTTNDPFDSLVFTVDSLRELANDPTSSPELIAAATYMANNPHVVEVTAAWEGTGASLPSHGIEEIPLRDIEVFLERNDLLRHLLDPARFSNPSSIHDRLTNEELTAAGISPDRFDELGLPRHVEHLIIDAINHHTFNHSPSLAREFVATLPIHYLDGQSLDMHRTDGEAIEQLYQSATSDLGNSQEGFITRALVTASLPESTSGVRNELITSNYAEVAAWANELLNGSVPATDPDYRGNNWFHLGTSASDSVSPVIEGRLRVLSDLAWPGFGTPEAVEQDVADGNQAIYHHFMVALGNLWQSGSTGKPRLDGAFTLLDEAAATDDIVEAQHLVAESTVLFSIEEQTVVDPYLQLDGLGLTDHVGTTALTFIEDTASNFIDSVTNPEHLFLAPLASVAHPMTVLAGTPFGLNQLGDSRSAAEVMTDEGTLTVQSNGEDLVSPIAIGAPVPTSPHANNYIDSDVLADRLPEQFDWSQGPANDWTSLDQRMPVIADVAVLTLTEPALPEMVADQRQGNLATPR